MKWITLKTKNLPIIALEIDRAIEVFQGLIERYQTTLKRQDMLQLLQLKSQFLSRIDQLNLFYRQHFAEDNISIFHMLKIKMERLVFKTNNLSNDEGPSFSDLSFKEEHDQLFAQNQIRILDQPLFTYYQSNLKKSNQREHEMEKDPIIESKNKKGNNDEKVKYFKETGNSKSDNKFASEKVQASQLNKVKKTVTNIPVSEKKKVNEIQKEPISPIKTINVPKTISKNQKIIKPIAQKDIKAYKTHSSISHSQSHKNSKLQTGKALAKPTAPLSFVQEKQESPMDFMNILQSQSQLKFTIKMTKDQYQQLLRLKQKLKKQGKQGKF